MDGGYADVRTSDFSYDLPPELIAQAPLADRSAARLLVLRRGDGTVRHHTVRDLPDLLDPGDLLVVNDTRVLPARLFGRRPSGGRTEFLLLNRLHPEAGGDPALWVALARPARRLPAGTRVALLPRGADQPPLAGPGAEVVRPLGEGRVELRLEVSTGEELAALLEGYGQVPLPPYIHTPLADAERYQTVYARREGAVAAPTAGLHFTPELFAALERRGIGRAAVTLHVGLGTFRPVTVDDPGDHPMHAEWFELTPETVEAIQAARARGRRVVAVGTTVVRVLESQAVGDGTLRAGSGWTELYVLPGWRFRAVDALWTNFHLPRSTLLMLVSAFAGRDAVLGAYRAAVAERYRFFSFGDAMLIL
jgi:S-adenosylmethionine:tRNA ribosyltransferase-isomerase